jgi:hypothetical protein
VHRCIYARAMDMSGESNLRRAIEEQWRKPSEKELLDFVQMVIESNRELATALKSLRDSYWASRSGKLPVKHADESLAQVEAALLQAEKIREKL